MYSIYSIGTIYYILKPGQNQSLFGQGSGSSRFLVGEEHNQERSLEAFIEVVRRHEINRRVVQMLKVLCAEDSPLCLDGSSTCAGFTAVPDGNFVLSKAHAYKSNRMQQIRLSSTPSYLGPKYDGVEVGTQIRRSRGQKKKTGFERVVFGQIQPHKIGLSDLSSPNSQIQFRYTPNTMPIKDGLRTKMFS